MSLIRPVALALALTLASCQNLPPEADPPLPVPEGKVQLSLNQAAYFADGPKIAAVAGPGQKLLEWNLKDAATGAIVASGLTSAPVSDLASSDSVRTADFSGFTTPGVYQLGIEGLWSPSFRIDSTWARSLARDAGRFFSLQRSGIALKSSWAGETWARDAGHLSDNKITAYEKAPRQWNLLFNGAGGWYDAGDFGKYVVNGGIAVWTLQNAVERRPAAFPDKEMTIPESGDGVSDLLNEARWEMQFLLNMQIPDGQPLEGMTFHKLHDRKWGAVPTDLPVSLLNNNNHEADLLWGRFVYQPTTAATLNLAATAAQAFRLWKTTDAAFAARCLAAARKAWQAARDNPSLLAGNVPGEGGGNYDDKTVSDEFYWAACELFAATGDPEYGDFVRSQKAFRQFKGLEANASASMGWGDTGALGTLTLLTAPNGLTEEEKALLRDQVVKTADKYLSKVNSTGYRVPLEAGDYYWGSNSVVLNNALILALAFDLTAKPGYRDAVVHAVDYLLGMNGLRKSFISGYGADPMAYPHHRLWVNDSEAELPPPPPGVVAGGPNANIEDPDMEKALLRNVPEAKRYLDTLGSYATNEVAINWNAPLVWVASWLDQQYNPR